MTNQELKNVLELHREWLFSKDGKRANLRNANLRYANLRNANLENANLRNANLSSIRKDFFDRLLLAKDEIVGLYDFIVRGKINGSSYEGECACFVGSIAKIRHEPYNGMDIDLISDADSPTERWFLAIQTGDTPQNNPVSKITAEWIEEFAKENGIELPTYKLVSSIERA